jgi:hypothetical protein
MQRSITQGSHWAARPVPKMGQQLNINRISIHSAHKRILKPIMSSRIGANSTGDEVLRTLSENGEVAIIVVDGTNLVREVSVIRNYRMISRRRIS